MTRGARQIAPPDTRPALGGLALLLLLALIATVPATALDDASSSQARREAGVAGVSRPVSSAAKTAPGAFAKVVRDLVGGSTLAALAHGASAIHHDSVALPAPRARECDPKAAALSGVRPDLMNIPPPTL